MLKSIDLLFFIVLLQLNFRIVDIISLYYLVCPQIRCLDLAMLSQAIQPGIDFWGCTTLGIFHQLAFLSPPVY